MVGAPHGRVLADAQGRPVALRRGGTAWSSVTRYRRRILRGPVARRPEELVVVVAAENGGGSSHPRSRPITFTCSCARDYRLAGPRHQVVEGQIVTSASPGVRVVSPPGSLVHVLRRDVGGPRRRNHRAAIHPTPVGRRTMRRAYKFRLRPTARQHVALGQCLDAHRTLYNAGLQERRDAYELVVRRSPNYFSTRRPKAPSTTHASRRSCARSANSWPTRPRGPSRPSRPPCAK
jgi:hypothetical protein